MEQIRWTQIYTKREDQTDTYIYTIRLNNRPPLKQRGKIRRTPIYTMGGNQTDTYNVHILRRRSAGHIYILRGNIRRTHIYTIRLNHMTPLKRRGKIRRTYL